MWWACWLLTYTPSPPTPHPPSAPPGDVDNNTITRELVSLTRANLLWTAPPDNNAAITYTISLCLLQANSLSSVCGAESAQDFTATEATIEISNLLPNRWYEVTIVASNAAGSSDPSDRFILMTTTSGECALRSGARKPARCAIACVCVRVYNYAYICTATCSRDHSTRPY